MKSYSQHFRSNLKLAYPIMAGQVGQIAVNLADNIMVGHLGSAALAAVSLAHAVFVVFLVVGFGLSFAMPPLISEAHGGGQDSLISRYIKHSLLLNVLFALFTVGCIYLFNNALQYFDQDPEVVVLARPYLLISGFSMIPLMIFQTFRTYADGMSLTKPAMTAIIIGNILNIGMNYILIFGHWGAPAMGVHGAALSTLIARCLMVVIIFIILFRHEQLWSHIAAMKLGRYTVAHFRKILNLGIPSVFQGLFEISAFSGAALIMGTISKEAQAAHQIAISLASMTFLICTGLSMAATIRVGNHYGKKDYVSAREIGVSNIILVTIFMTITSVVIYAFHDLLPLLYIDDPRVVTIASSLLVYAAIFQIPDGIQVTALGALRGIQDVKVPTVITFVAYWMIGIPISYISVNHFGWGTDGVWLGLILGLTISAMFQSYRFSEKSFRSTA